MELWNHTAPSSQLESYTVVLSISSLILAALFGLAGSCLLLLALSKLSRTLTNSLFASVLAVDVWYACIWIPMEITQLLQFYMSDTVVQNVKLTKHTLYIFQSTINLFCISLICVKSLTNIACRERKLFYQRLLLISLVGSWILSFVIGLAYCVVSAYNEPNSHTLNHLMMNTASFQFKIVILTTHVLISVVVIALLLATTKLRNLDSDDRISDAESDTQGELSTCLPVIQEPSTLQPLGEINTEDNLSATSTPKLQIDKGIKNSEEDKPCLPALPGAGKRRSSLQVNLANLLNRRRHTICQIGATGTNTDPQGKSLQYNYVRKFSVDVMALQAQLENPKVHGGSFPFQSEQNLGEQSQKGLNGSLIKDSKISLPSIQEAENEGGLDVINQVPNLSFLSEQFEKRKSSEQRHVQDKLRQLRLCLIMIVTYLCCMLPLYIGELLHGAISTPAYINTIICTTALSLLQIIIYPYLFLCMDTNIHKTTHKLFDNIQQRWHQRGEGGKSPVTEPNTTETNATQL